MAAILLADTYETLYDVDGEIYFSEFTFVPTGGNMKLKPEHYLDDWGKLLRLP